MKKRIWCFLSLFVFVLVITLGTSFSSIGQSAEIQKKIKIESKQQRPPNKFQRLKEHKERYLNLLSSDNPVGKPTALSSEVELVGVWPYGPCLASALDTFRNIALVSSGYALQILDISTPETPSVIGEIVLDNKPWLIAISGDYAYVVVYESYSAQSKLKVIHISDPTSPAEVNEIGFVGWPSCMDISSNYLCVAGLWGGLTIIDITNPAAPTQVGTYTADGNIVYEVAIWNNYALIVNEYFDDPNWVYQMRVLDISSPGSPSLTGTYQAALDYFITGIDVVPSGNVYITQYDWIAAKLTVFDLASTAGDPTELGSYTEAKKEFEYVEVQGNYAYIYDYRDCELLVFDVSNPLSISKEGNVYSTCSFEDMDLSGNYVGISVREWGLELFDVSNPANPLYVVQFETSAYVEDVVVSGDYAYLANRMSGLRILDISDPTHPIEVGLCDSVFAGGRIAVSGTYAYCIDESYLLWVVDVSTPSSPFSVDYYDSSTWYPNGVYVQGDYAYLYGNEWIDPDYFSRMDILDISTPTSPAFLGTYSCSDPSFVYGAVAFSDHHAFLPLTDYSGIPKGSGLRIIDVLDPTSPNEVGSFRAPDSGSAYGVAIHGNYAFLASRFSTYGFRVIDISDPATPSEVASLMKNGNDIGLSGNYIYLCNSGGLTVIDISDPNNPVEAGYYTENSGFYFGMALDIAGGNHAYCAGSLVILKNLMAPEAELTSPSPGATVSETVALSADASHASGIAQVDFYVDGVLEGTDTTSPYSYSWNSRSVANGVHTIKAQAINNNGKSSDTEEVEIVVDNAALFRLTIATGPGGTTDPPPGEHDYAAGIPVEVEAIPDTGYVFSHWTGDVPSGHENDNPVTITVDANKSITAHFTVIILKEDLIGTWSSGVWYRNTETGSWVKMTTPANSLAAGDIDGDGKDDVIGVWSSGLWVKQSSDGSWIKLSSSLPGDIAAGDMNGDGRDDVLGTWTGSGVWYRDSSGGSWVKLTSAADMVAAGDIDGDGTDDLIGTWSSGLWVRFGSTGSWNKISTALPVHIASGDMNGDGRDDVLGTWPSGVYYKDSIGGTWSKMSLSPASLVAAGDLDGDGTQDLIGVWSSGIWVKYSSTISWGKITLSLPSDIDAGLYRVGTWDKEAWR